MKTPPQIAATIAVRAAKVIARAGGQVRRWGFGSSGRSVYVYALINGKKFTVRISDHYSRMNGTHAYFFVRVDWPDQAGLQGLPDYIRHLDPSSAGPS